MPLIRLIPLDYNFDFMKVKYWFFAISILITVASAILVVVPGLNFGVDFRGGIVIEVKTNGQVELDDWRSELGALGLGEITLQTLDQEDVVLISLSRQEGDEGAQEQAIQQVRAVLGDRVAEYRRVEAVGPKVGDELRIGGIIATVLALAGIALYVWVRFDLAFGVAALISLLHDVIGTVGYYALTGTEFQLTTLAAVLTVAGYSINDTVVVFDRVRDDLRRYKKMPIPALLNKAINATLPRTFLTGVSTLLALLGLFLFGGEVLRGFSAGIIIGIVLGTFSSIGLAVPLLTYAHLRRGKYGGKAATPDKAALPAKGSEAS